MAKRLFASVASLVLLVLLAEGALSLFAGRSFTELFSERGYVDALLEQQQIDDASARTEDARPPGPYRGHPDPYIGYAFKRNAELVLAGTTFRTDGLGMRERPGPPPPGEAFRIVVLGDSIAFGKGLAPDEVLAVRLEEILDACRGPDAVPVACTTIAVPSWNYRNAARFLLDHFDRIAPDLVLYMAVPNDLDDSFGADETGRRTLIADPGALDPLVSFFGGNITYFVRAGARARNADVKIDQERLGPAVGDADLTTASSRRLDDMAGTLAELDQRLRSLGSRLALLPFEQHATHRRLVLRLSQRGVELPTIPLLERLLEQDSQEDDPHPSARTTEVFALWTAQSLLELGLVPGELVEPLPPVPAAYRDRRAVELVGEELAAWCAAERRSTESALESALVDATLQGMRQVYGGLNPDGTFGAGLLAVLPRGRELEVELAALEERPDLLPLEVTVAVDGELLGVLVLRGGAAKETFTLTRAAANAPFEVRLTPAHWAVLEDRGREVVAAARFVALRSRP